MMRRDKQFMKKVMFICTGNTCRSPMAECIFKFLLRKRGLDGIYCESAGTEAYPGDPAQRNSIIAASEYGADISDHRSRRFHPLMAEDTDLFVCMSARHILVLKEMGGVEEEKILLLDGGVPDPYGGTLDQYRAAAAQIANALLVLIDDIASNKLLSD